MIYHSKEVKEVLIEKKSSVEGLSETEAKERLNNLGENKLVKEKGTPPWRIFIRQFKESVIYILLFAATLSFVLKEFLDAWVITAILVFNAILGFAQEYKAERAVELLKKLTTLSAKVSRGGVLKEIPSSALVPGDIVILEAGDKVPADMRVIESNNLKTNEATLTGESVPCSKTINSIAKDTDLAERKNMVYSGTAVATGTGKAVVVETGMSTEIGKITALVQSVEHIETPLQIKLKQLGKVLTILVIIICVLVVGIGLLQHNPFYAMVLTAVSLAVAAIPEGLPAVVTICLALSVQRMIKKNALVKKLKSVETLGDITVICSDKTGTLTKNEMTVRKLFVNNTSVDVTGYGYTTEGEFLIKDKKTDPRKFRTLLDIAASCNNATETVGDPTEKALLFCALKGDGDRLERTGEIPFDADKKFMATKHQNVTFYKGAVEVILAKCSMVDLEGKTRRILPKDNIKINQVNHEMASNALRVLALAYEKRGNIFFVGLMGMIDPPKEGVQEAVRLCRIAGIRPVMITGDHPITAVAIGRKIGVTGKALTGHDLDKMDEKALQKAVIDTPIFARTSSTHKVRILRALQANGEIVAMTGDGINDAPALKSADVGVAMAVKGTDVSRDAADMVLTDDNFSSIVEAIKQGRIVYDNIKKFVHYLLSSNIVEVGVVLLAIAFGFPLPLLPIHILWVNLMTDSWPAIALGVDNPKENIMRRKPRKKTESILKGLSGSMITTGVVGVILVLGMFIIKGFEDITYARTMTLSTLILFELFRAYSCRSTIPFIKSMFANKWLNMAVGLSLFLQLIIMYTPLNIPFRLVPLGVIDWALIVGLAFGGFAVIEIQKWMVLKRNTVVM